MSTDRPKRESLSLEEATISNMWQIAEIAGGPLLEILASGTVLPLQPKEAIRG